MVLTTIPNFGEKPYAVLGMVSGSMVQSKNMFKDIGAGLKILGVNYSTSSIVQGAAEVLATGTAVRLL